MLPCALEDLRHGSQSDAGSDQDQPQEQRGIHRLAQRECGQRQADGRRRQQGHRQGARRVVPARLDHGPVRERLCLGLLTPYCAAVSCVLEVALLISTRDPSRFQLGMAALTAAAAVGLGPGAYSVDSRLFGRKVIEIPAGRDSQ